MTKNMTKYLMSTDELPAKVQIQNLKKNTSLAFPIEKICSIRALASTVGLELGKKYRTRCNREDRVVIVSCLG